MNAFVEKAKKVAQKAKQYALSMSDLEIKVRFPCQVAPNITLHYDSGTPFRPI